MCPLCLATTAAIVAASSTSGGLGVLLVKKARGRWRMPRRENPVRVTERVNDKERVKP